MNFKGLFQYKNGKVFFYESEGIGRTATEFSKGFEKGGYNVEKSHLRDIMYLYVIKSSHGGVIMAVSYKKLFHLLIERDMTTVQLQQKAGFSANIITRMKRNGYLSLDTIESICRTMNCGVDDILEFMPENTEEE